MKAVPSARVIRRALNLVDQLPAEALAALVDGLITKLDEAEPDTDLEGDDFDACLAEDMPIPSHFGLGDADDAECGGDPEPDDTDHGASEDEPDFDTLRRAFWGAVPVRPASHTVCRGEDVTWLT